MRQLVKCRFHILLLFLSFFCLQHVFSSHLMGGEITYTWLGAKKYELTATMYRDCRGIPLDSPIISVFSDDKKIAIQIKNYKRTSIEDITPSCNGKSPCSPANQTTTEGVEMHVFKATIDFGTAPYNAFITNNVCKVFFGLEQCCRNGAITTISPGNFFVESMLDLCNSGFKNTSPQFYSTVSLYTLCNQPFITNLGAIDDNDFDSLSFSLEVPMNAHNSSETYSGSFRANLPLTPYCPPNPGVINCKPVPNAKPPRGFYFDPQTGNLVATPTKCDEVAVLSVKTSEFRKDSSGTWRLLGFVVRDIQVIIKVDAQYKNILPEVKLSNSYTFKTGERQCIDIATLDSLAIGYSNSNPGDTTSMKILNMPPGADFTYLDSNASSKTGRFCWTIHDSVYLGLRTQSKLIPLILEVKDNYCPSPGQLRQTFFIRAAAPDSSGFLEIETYHDLDKNSIKNSGEKNIKAKLRVKDISSSYYIQTDEGGLFEDSISKGDYKIGVAPHPYIVSDTKDTLLKIQFNNSHKLQFGVRRKPGIYGRIYEDRNGNCQFDQDEYAVPGIKVSTDSNVYTGVTDNDGRYYISAPAGSYRLTCHYKPFSMDVKCPSNNTRNLTVIADSIHDDNDFAVGKNRNYTDISAYVMLSRLRRGANAGLNIYCKNKGNKTAYNVKLYIPVDGGMILKRDTTTIAAGGSVAIITIDSILPGGQNYYGLGFYVSPSVFKSNDKICFSLYTDSTTTAADSVKSNNSSSSCAIVDAPFDPNEKVVDGNPVKTPLDKTISYTIHFQNTGTDTAFRVMVTDTIHTKHLDLAGFEMNWSDYPCETIIEGNIIHFIFDNIRLPQLAIAGDKSISGFNFSLGLKSSVINEQSFTNRASIYFDYEDPIHTVEAKTGIMSPVAISRLTKTSLCENSEATIYFNSRFKPEDDNMFILEMSDSKGGFTSPVTIAGTISNAAFDSIVFTPPAQSYGNFKLRIRTTNPESVSIPGSGITGFLSLERPDFSVSTNLKQSRICAGDSLKVTINSGKYDYKILRNNISSGNFGSQKTYSYLPSKQDEFAVVARDNDNHCTDTSYIFMEVTDQPVVTVSIDKRKAAYCDGETLNLHAGGAQYYSFYDGSILLKGLSTQSVYTALLNKSAVFSIYGEDMYGCSNTSDTLMVRVNPLPAKPVISKTNNTLSINFKGQIEWFRDGVSLGYKDTVANARTGVYKVIVTTPEGCSTVSDDFNSANTNVNAERYSPFKVYPNPANGIVFIEGDTESISHVRLFAPDGKSIDLECINSSLNVSVVSSGVYTMVIYGRDGSVSGRSTVSIMH